MHVQPRVVHTLYLLYSLKHRRSRFLQCVVYLKYGSNADTGLLVAN